MQAAFLAEERDPETTMFSLRSVAPYNVAAVAVPLGGGGHERAAGVTLSKPMDEAIEIVSARLTALVEGR